MQWKIYCHIHSATGRKYVGQTRQSINDRWRAHCWQAKNAKTNRYFFANAIRKYGPEAFTHGLLETCDSQEAANEAETRWISELRSDEKEFGFNRMKGGQGFVEKRKSPWSTPEAKEKLFKQILPELIAAAQTPEARAKAKATKNTPEWKAKASVRQSNMWELPEFREKMAAVHSTPEWRAERAEVGRNTPLAIQHRNQTHCKAGHEFTAENTGHNTKGGRICRICKNARERQYYGPLKSKTPKTHCVRGHEFTEENTWYNPRGGRGCRACNRENQRARNSRLKHPALPGKSTSPLPGAFLKETWLLETSPLFPRAISSNA